MKRTQSIFISNYQSPVYRLPPELPPPREEEEDEDDEELLLPPEYDPEEDEEDEDYEDIADHLRDFKKVFINAKILEESGEEWKFNEGCLSIPDVREDVKRKETIVIATNCYSDNYLCLMKKKMKV